MSAVVPSSAARGRSSGPLLWSSVTRIVDREGLDIDWEPRPRSEWRDGDYVVAEAQKTRAGMIEAPDGHYVNVVTGDLVVGALGVRRATLEAVGDWRSVGRDGVMQSLTRGGVLGRVTSAASSVLPLVVDLRYRGHLQISGATARMSDWALAGPLRPPEATTPAIALIGTSMSSGKTTTARFLIRRLVAMGLTVAGAKFAGVGRFGDVLAMRDSGASTIFDFVDAGLPSTVARREVVVDATRRILAAVDAHAPDVLVCEVGASPLEPYQGDAVLEELGSRVRMVILCASDPYAVVGAVEAFGVRPDLVTGRAAATSAGVALVSRLSELDAVDVTDPGRRTAIDEVLRRGLGIGPPQRRVVDR